MFETKPCLKCPRPVCAELDGGQCPYDPPTKPEIDDSDVVYAMQMCKALGVKVYVRGTDDDPKIIVTDRMYRVIGGLDLKHRIKVARVRGVTLPEYTGKPIEST